MNQVDEDVAAFVSHEWQTARQIHKRMDCWAPRSCRYALERMWELGTVERRVLHRRAGLMPIHEYRIATSQQSQPKITSGDSAQVRAGLVL